MAKYKVGMIGCGRMGVEHGRGYEVHPDTEIVAAADPDTENLEAFCERFGVRARYTDYREMLEKEEFDIAGIVVPVSVNPEAVIAAAEAGVKAIFAEKPIAASLEEADNMVETCRAKAIPFACGAIWRNHPYLQKAKELLETGEIGEILSVTCLGMENEVSGGGCHALNVVRLLAGDAEVDWVIGWVENDPWSDDDQGAGGYLHFANGIDGYVHMRRGAKTGVEVQGKWGVFYWNWRQVSLWKEMAPWEQTPSRFLQPMPLPLPKLFHPEIYPAITNGIQALLNCLEQGGEPLCSGEDMQKVLEIAIAMRESHRRGRIPVHLSLKDRSLKIIPKPHRWLGAKAAQA